MELLDFQRLKKRFELKKTVGTVKIILFSKTESGFTVHSQGEHSDTFLKENNPIGTVGEVYVKNKEIFVCVGKSDEPELIKRTNVQKAMKSVYQNLKKFDNHEILFLEKGEAGQKGESEQKREAGKSSVFSSDFNIVEEAIYSLILSSYSYDFLKKTKDNFLFFLNSEKYQKIIKIAHLQNVARFLGDTPANLMTPSLFVDYAQEIFKGDNVEIQAYSKEFMEKNQMNLILSVSQGSVQEPKLLSIKYKGRDSDGTDIALVGKGVSFDTGGISIKPSAGMYLMKQDMMGAATLLCSLKIAISLGIPSNFSAVFPLVENMPSGSATKPGDVFTSMSGLTVEVDNTDAEGRLILADALTFAQLDKPKYLIDAATLTGAMVIALGAVYAGFFTDDNVLADKISQAGQETSDLLWRMPLSPYYTKELKSHVADLNNMGGREGGSCKAAGFLSEFVNTKECSWVHFDIAGMMENSYNSEMYGKQATGKPIRAFVNLFEKLNK